MKKFTKLMSMLGGVLLAFPPMSEARESKPLSVGAVSLRPFGKANISVAFLQRMEELGYRRGRNFRFEFIQLADRSEYGRAYRELVARNVDILAAGGPEFALKAAMAATRNLPIVMIASDYDPFERGYVASLARPGGNVTGIFFQQIALTKKRLQLMKEAFPHVQAVTVFWDRISADQWKGAQLAAEELRFNVHGVELREQPYDYGRALADVAPRFRGALMVLASPVFSLPRRSVLPEVALRYRIPTMFHVSFYPEVGGLMSYGVSFTKLFRRAADYVDKIARGTKPANLPIERSDEFELVVNLKTAQALGVRIPPSVLLRADRVIE